MTKLRKQLVLSAVVACLLTFWTATPAHAEDLDLIIAGEPDPSVPPVAPPFPGGLKGKIRGDVNGTYREELIPTLFGSIGFSRFNFAGGQINTANVSHIVGVDPYGFLIVMSTGEIISGKGTFKNATGSFVSFSIVDPSTFEFVAMVTMTLD